jgi:hypothetical protein
MIDAAWDGRDHTGTLLPAGVYTLPLGGGFALDRGEARLPQVAGAAPPIDRGAGPRAGRASFRILTGFSGPPGRVLSLRPSSIQRPTSAAS